jgi:hypothetical protein
MDAGYFLGQLQTVDADWLKNFLLVVVSSIGAGGGLISIISTRRKQRREVSFAAELVDKSACALKHEDVGRRLESLEESRDEMWRTLRSEIEAVRLEMRKGFADQERALGRIEGKIMGN